jgi:hypothetical protein
MDIRFAEEMAGTYQGRAAGIPGSGKFRFQVKVECADAKDPRVVNGTLSGKVFMEGVVDGAILEGTIEISPHWKRIIGYHFTFPVNGKTYRFDGEKKISPFSLVKSMTTLPGSVFDDQGKEIATSTTYFNVKRDILPFLLSYRFSLPAFRT